jgi:hypothetical protein
LPASYTQHTHTQAQGAASTEDKTPPDPLAVLANAMRAGKPGPSHPVAVAWGSAILGDERVEYVRGPELATVLAKTGVPEIDAVAATMSALSFWGRGGWVGGGGAWGVEAGVRWWGGGAPVHRRDGHRGPAHPSPLDPPEKWAWG